MIQILKKDFNKIIDPLKKVNFNTLFAASVIEGHVSGNIFIDKTDKPNTFYIVHPYGMALLFGDPNNEKFNSRFQAYSLNRNKSRNKHEWMQAYPNSWHNKLNELFKGLLIKSSDNIDNIQNQIIELNTRVNFCFNLNKYLEFKKNTIKKKVSIVRVDQTIFKSMKGSVVPSGFWDNASCFVEKGIGFSLIHEGQIATTAFSSCINDTELELGMETLSRFRGKGFALYACSALIDYCIDNNYEPIWACSLENTPSYNLAIKLGFEPYKQHPYYRLSN